MTSTLNTVTAAPISFAVFSASAWSKSQIATLAPERDEAFGDGAAKALRAAGDDGEASVQIDLVHAVLLELSCCSSEQVQPPSMM